MNPILENIKLKSEHAILTESTSTEIEKLEAKILLNEAIQEVNAYFTEASIDGVKKHLKKNWKKYALGAAAVGAGTVVYKNQDAIKAKANELSDTTAKKFNAAKSLVKSNIEMNQIKSGMKASADLKDGAQKTQVQGDLNTGFEAAQKRKAAARKALGFK